MSWAHRLGLAGLASGRAVHAPRVVMGLRFDNAVGLAAGLDKNGDYLDALGALGFGFIELGTVTPRPQPGNPPPRMFRLPAARALINRMGFNNQGVDHLIDRVRRSRYRGVLGINIGKNRDTPMEQATQDYLMALRKIYPYAGYVAINLSSPNTPDLRRLQFGDALHGLLATLKTEQALLAERHGRYVPLALKIAPDLESPEIRAIAEAVLAHSLDALIATNTTVSRVGVSGLAHAQEQGGLSGAPLGPRATEVVRALHDVVQHRVPIIAAGGIMSASDAREKVAAGAALVQLYTGLIYRGPTLVREVARALG